MHHSAPRTSTRLLRCAMRCLAALIGLLALAVAAIPPAHAISRIVYVKADATGIPDGRSWTTAYTDLQIPLTNAFSGQQIWVAAGTYTPTTGSDQTVSFTLKDGVAVYGGFAGIETLLSQRSWLSNVTILSGDIGTSGVTSDNSYHVVTGADGATLDGFTISGGNANNGSYPANVGAGVYNSAASPTLTNVTISGNTAIGAGSGLYNFSSSPTLTNVTISDNTTTGNGGGIYNFSSSPMLTNVSISGNSATGNGGGIFSEDSSSTLTNVTISDNTATNRGGGLYNSGSSTTLTNVTIANNQASTSGAGLYISSGGADTPQIRNSIIWGNRVGSNISSIAHLHGTAMVSSSIVEGGYSGTGNLDADPLFVSAVAASSAPTTSGDYHLQVSSPAIDAGTNAALPTDIHDLDSDSDTSETLPYDRDGDTRVMHGTVDMGADEVDPCAPYASPYTVPASDTAALSAAITCANANADANVIELTNSTYSFSSGDATHGDSALPQLSTPILLNGNGATIQRASGSPSFRLLLVSPGASVSLSNLTLSGGQDSYGGAIYNNAGTVTVINCIVSGNQAGTSGGGIYNSSGTVVVINSTISGNSGEGLFNSNGTFTVTNSIVWGNSTQIWDATVTSSIVEGGYGGTGNLDLDPLFVSPVSYANAPVTGGEYSLQISSPAIDAGSTATLPTDAYDLDGDSNTNETIPFDYNGDARIVNTLVDIGAYEWQANLPPTLAQPASVTLLEDAGTQTVSLSGIGSRGGSQTLIISAVSSNPALIPHPLVSYTSPNTSGSLSFTPAADASGTATITMTVQDSGGTANGGVDTLTRSFSVTVTAVNDAPDFTPGANQMVQASTGAQMVTGWASGFSAGPVDEASQTLVGYSVVSTTNADLFSVAPAIDAAGALIYTPKPGAGGTATISVVVRDSGGTANGGSDTSVVRTFTITVGTSYQIYLPLVLRA